MWRDEFMTDLALPLPILAARLLGAAVLCGLIGFERESSSQSAGLRTHMTVGVAAACFALITLHIVEIYAERPDVQMDPIRMVEATTAGVAFLAAGMIVLTKGEVRNLTTGAGMWLAGAIGLAVGLGLWPVAVISALMALVIMGLLGRFTHRREREKAQEASADRTGGPPERTQR